MVRDTNVVVLSGTADSKPSSITLKNNKKLSIFTLLTVEKYMMSDGTVGYHDNFVEIEALGRVAEKCQTEVKPGRRYHISGYLRVDDINGVDKVRVRAYNIQEE